MFPFKIGGIVAGQFSALDLKSCGPWFNTSTLPLSGFFVLDGAEFTSATMLSKYPTGEPPIGWDSQ